MSESLTVRASIGIGLVMSLISLAIIANAIGWPGGADKILTAALVLVCAIPISSFFKEIGKDA